MVVVVVVHGDERPGQARPGAARLGQVKSSRRRRVVVSSACKWVVAAAMRLCKVLAYMRMYMRTALAGFWLLAGNCSAFGVR